MTEGDISQEFTSTMNVLTNVTPVPQFVPAHHGADCGSHGISLDQSPRGCGYKPIEVNQLKELPSNAVR